MDNQSLSGLLKKYLAPGETILYKSPRKWSMLVDPLITLVFALLLGFAYLFLSVWLGNIITNIKELPMFTRQVDLDTAQVINIARWVMLGLSGVCLISFLVRVAAFMGAEITLTDQRILGKTGRSFLRRVNIPFEQISWVYYPNKIFSKGPVIIFTRNGKSVTLWNLAKPEIFLGYLTTRYTTETLPVIKRPVVWAVAFRILVGLVFIAAGIFLIYSAQKPVLSNITATRTPEATLVFTTTPTPKPTSTPVPVPVKVDFESIHNYPLKTLVSLVGQLALPGNIHCDSHCEAYCEYYCGVYLRNPANHADIVYLALFVPTLGNTPSPNQMARLGDQYHEVDFQVRLDNGEYVGNFATVRITGTICETTSGGAAICDITKIEPETPE